MAADALNTTRRTLLGAAASLLPAVAFREGGSPTPHTVRAEPVEALPSSPGSAEWTALVTRYETLFARAKAAAETGWFRAANDRHHRETALPATDHEAAFARISRAEDLYWRRCTAPMQGPNPRPHPRRAKLKTRRHPRTPAARGRQNGPRLHRRAEEDVGRLEVLTI